jgi:hypothetical protein
MRTAAWLRKMGPGKRRLAELPAMGSSTYQLIVGSYLKIT